MLVSIKKLFIAALLGETTGIKLLSNVFSLTNYFRFVCMIDYIFYENSKEIFLRRFSQRFLV